MSAASSLLSAVDPALNAPARQREAGAQRFRIAMVAACPMPARRGTPLRVERLAEALSARGHHVELITYHVADDAQVLDFPVHRIFNRRLYWRMPAGPNLRKLFLYDPALAVKLWQVLAAGRFDVIHAHHLEGLLVALPARLRHQIPIVYDAHTMLSSELPSYGPSFTRRAVGAVGTWLDGVLPRGADHVAAVTNDIRDRLIGHHGMNPDCISVVTNGVEMANFRIGTPAHADGITRLIYTGTLAAYQDVDLLLEAFAKARRVRPDLRLSMAVSNPFDPYEAQAARLGIRDAIDLLPDSFDELPRQLAASTVAVLPRRHCPGIPQKLLNYMAAGKAIVCSAGSAKLLENERTGLVVPNGDVEAFSQALLRLVGNPALAHELGNRAREQVEHSYSWDHAAERLERIYEQLVPAAAVAR
ncbi:MAG: glycosyltransferase family 1 protein [Gammaproteobacteria bacterium]|nr:glycosyltransferase family 1 protein [Gammaproteobacteria bacterium]